MKGFKLKMLNNRISFSIKTTYNSLLTSSIYILASCFLLLASTTYASTLIKDIKTVDRSKHSITILVTTYKPTQGKIRYGIMNNRLDNIVYSIGPITEHYISMSNLPERSEVWYRVEATDTEAHSQITHIYKEETTGIPPLKVISNTVTNLTDSGALLLIKTNLPTKMWFEAGIEEDRIQEIGDRRENDEGRGMRDEKIEDRSVEKALALLNNEERKDGISGTNNGSTASQQHSNTIKAGSDSKIYRTYHGTYIVGHGIQLEAFPPLTDIYYHYLVEDTMGRITNSNILSFKTKELNAALNKKVEGTFDDNSKITDGLLDYFNGIATSGDPANSEQWCIIDLEDYVEIDKIITYWRRIARPLDFSLYGSLNGEDWQLITENLSSENGESGISRTGDPLRIVTAEANGVMYRYIKLYIAKGAKYFRKRPGLDFVQLFEFKVYPKVRVKD